VTPVVIRASVLGRLLGIRLLRLEADITLVPAGPRVVHRWPIPPCRHEFPDHGREPRSHRCTRAVGACVSYPRRDIPHRHVKEARIIAVRV
jgi:hypothetical protein